MKSQQIINFLDNYSKDVMYGRTWKSGMCPSCKNDDDASKVKPDDFRDDLSREEYRISHLCQKCQDEVWGK